MTGYRRKLVKTRKLKERRKATIGTWNVGATFVHKMKSIIAWFFQSGGQTAPSAGQRCGDDVPNNLLSPKD
jgi:hypothetical protein